MGVNTPLDTCNECILLPYRQLCLNNKDSLYSDRVSYGTVTAPTYVHTDDDIGTFYGTLEDSMVKTEQRQYTDN